MKTIYFVTGNKNKFAEFENKLKGLEIKSIQKDIGYPEIQSDSLEEVVKFGIEDIKHRFDGSFIIEDAGLFIEALLNFPGVYSKFVFYSIGLDGVLKLLEKTENRKATFRSVFGLYEPNKKSKFFIGECKGHITSEEKGKHGFGYDPIFIPDDTNKTFAEMTIDEKNKYSHRAKALEKLILYLKTNK